MKKLLFSILLLISVNQMSAILECLPVLVPTTYKIVAGISVMVAATLSKPENAAKVAEIVEIIKK